MTNPVTNPVRNHLSLPGFGAKLGDRMDATSRHLCDEIRRVLDEYKEGPTSAPAALRELDAVQALVGHNGTILGPTRLVWEGEDVFYWLPAERNPIHGNDETRD